MLREVKLEEILIAREERMNAQNELLAAYGKPLVSFLMNIAGPVKNTPLIERAFEEGVRMLEAAFAREGIKVLTARQKKAVTGCEALYAVSEEANGASEMSDDGIPEDVTIKRLCVAIEEGSRLGRLFDIDVIRPDGVKIERAVERKCLICGKPGKGCASRRLHSVSELQQKTRKIIEEYFATQEAEWVAQNASVSSASENASAAMQEAERVADMVTNALIEEVLTTPKPGLVDRNNNGSHTDMDIETFMTSAHALRDYWKQCFLIGYSAAMHQPEKPEKSATNNAVAYQKDETPTKDINEEASTIDVSELSASIDKKEQPSENAFCIEDDKQTSQLLFEKLREAGLQAESEMYKVTGGVNTHKGAIFLLGIVCGAIGRLFCFDVSAYASKDERTDYQYDTACIAAHIDPARIAEECSKMTREIMKRELEEMSINTDKTKANSVSEDVSEVPEEMVEDRKMLETDTESHMMFHGNKKMHNFSMRQDMRGARGEIADGLPGVIDTGLPVFRKLLARGADRNAAGIGAFIALVARGTDTNMVRRGGVELAGQASEWAARLVEQGRLLDTASIESLDKRYIELNLSPGGCADLLAITYFLHDYAETKCCFLE